MSIRRLSKRQSAKTHTHCGTPISPAWDQAWAATVEATELRLSRRICGARTIDGVPCTLFSDHPTGRCRFHGGHPHIGAPEANRNALLHGLFVRRLQDCGPHCPRFDRCPLAGPDVAELPATDRPACPYESLEYEVSIEDLENRSKRLNPDDDYACQCAHHIALMQVMVGRAAQAMTTGGEQSDLNAYLRLAAEYRRSLRLLSPSPVKAAAPKAEPRELGLADQLRPLLKSADGVLESALNYERRKLARKREKAARAAKGEVVLRGSEGSLDSWRCDDGEDAPK